MCAGKIAGYGKRILLLILHIRRNPQKAIMQWLSGHFRIDRQCLRDLAFRKIGVSKVEIIHQFVPVRSEGLLQERSSPCF